MRDQGKKAVYISLDENLAVNVSEIPLDEVFNSTNGNDQLEFNFESKFEPYQKYARDDIGGIDLVIAQHGSSKDARESWHRAMEVKLTVLPDNTTYQYNEDRWGCELVIRPASTKYCALGIRDAMSAEERSDIVDILEPVCTRIRQWESQVEVLSCQNELVDACNDAQRRLISLQKPFLMQPIWKTRGRSVALSDDAFDIFVWSDFALCRTFLDRAIEPGGTNMNRFLRSSARFARVLYELSRGGRIAINDIYTQMTYGLQTDKEFALSGRVTHSYMACDRLSRPALARNTIVEIIRNGGEKKLSPERRFDATIFFTAEDLFRSGGR